MRKLTFIALFLGCAGAQRESRSTPVLAPVAAPAQAFVAPPAQGSEGATAPGAGVTTGSDAAAPQKDPAAPGVGAPGAGANAQGALSSSTAPGVNAPGAGVNAQSATGSSAAPSVSAPGAGANAQGATSSSAASGVSAPGAGVNAQGATSSSAAPGVGAPGAGANAQSVNSSSAAPVSPAFADAVAAFEAGKLDDAKQRFESIPEDDAHRAAARYDLGVIAERQGDLAAAESHYREALALRPDSARTLNAIAQVLREQGQAAGAVPLYQAALQKHPDDLQLLDGLAAAQRNAGQREQAESTARRVLARSKDDADAYRTLALCALDAGTPRLAELYALTARKRAEKDASIANTLGLVYLALDQRPRALAELQRAVTLDPAFAPAHLNLAALALGSRDYATAEKSSARALSLQPWSKEGRLLRAWALDGLRAQDPRRGPDAGAAFEQVLAFKPDDPEATCGAGFGYGADRAGYDRALPFLEKCLSLAPTPQERQAAEARLKTIQAIRATASDGAEGKKDGAETEGSGGSGQAEDGPPPQAQ
jgi:tetratricopeptide (TPR) repeat protein